jgi:hypothetical protein
MQILWGCCPKRHARPGQSGCNIIAAGVNTAVKGRTNCSTATPKLPTPSPHLSSSGWSSQLLRLLARAWSGNKRDNKARSKSQPCVCSKINGAQHSVGHSPAKCVDGRPRCPPMLWHPPRSPAYRRHMKRGQGPARSEVLRVGHLHRHTAPSLLFIRRHWKAHGLPRLIVFFYTVPAFTDVSAQSDTGTHGRLSLPSAI